MLLALRKSRWLFARLPQSIKHWAHSVKLSLPCSSLIPVLHCFTWNLTKIPLTKLDPVSVHPIRNEETQSGLILFATQWTAPRQASLSITSSWSLLKLVSIESVMPSNHLILCRPLLLPPSVFPHIRVFQMSQFFASGGQRIGVSTSTSVLPMNIQDWFPLGQTGWISLQSKHQFFGTQLYL